MNLIDVAHLRAVCGRLGINRVNYLAGALVMKLVPAAAPDPGKLYQALMDTDKRLLLSAAREPAILLRDPRLTPVEMLAQAVGIMEKVEKAIR